MSSRQSRKAIWDMINTRFLTLQLWNLHLLLSFSTRRHTSMAFRAILSNFVEEQWTQNHLQYLSGLSQALFPRAVLEKALYNSNTWLVISLEYPHSLTATFCFPRVIPVNNIIMFFFSPSHEHHLLPPGEKVLVVVSEKETSSIIAYTLRWVFNTGTVLKKHSLLKKREGDWSRNVSRNCFWDGYLGRAGQLLANFYSPSPKQQSQKSVRQKLTRPSFFLSSLLANYTRM